MNCPNCQTPNRDDGRFCISCGYALPQMPAGQPAPAFQQPAPAYMPTAPQAGYPAQGSYAPAAPVYAPSNQAPAQAPTPQAQPLPAPGYVPAAPPTRVVVTDVNMTFSSMVIFMVKWAIAAVPALIILALILTVVSALLSAIGVGLLGGLF